MMMNLECSSNTDLLIDNVVITTMVIMVHHDEAVQASDHTDNNINGKMIAIVEVNLKINVTRETNTLFLSWIVNVCYIMVNKKAALHNH